jgi:hypothetical protein
MRALGVLVLLALVALAVAVGRERPTPAARPAAASPMVVAAPREVATPRLAIPAPRLDEGAGFDEVERAQVALRAHGRGCWERRVPQVTPPGQPDETTQSLRLYVRLVVEAGEGRAELVEVADDQVTEPGLRACLADVSRVRWASPGPAGVTELRELLRMGDFTVPLGPPGPSVPRPEVVPAERRPPLPPGLVH